MLIKLLTIISLLSSIQPLYATSGHSKGHSYKHKSEHKHSQHKPKIFKHHHRSNDKLIIHTPQWFDYSHSSGFYVFGLVQNISSDFRVLVNREVAQIDSSGNFSSKVSINNHFSVQPNYN